jgi:hypothetical protein
VSFLELAKQAEARLRAQRGGRRDDAINAVDAVNRRPRDVASAPVDVFAAYRAALHEFWRLVALAPAVDPATAIRTLDKVARLIDVVGEPVATELRHRLEAEWHRDTGRCARCGDSGERHT